ncbi:23S rRNA (pseudouridine(1915)-N(3))-methyltransferase RlmH [Schleiferia thermophila]|uniref:Ribosomal RNA large subunit methyltransferase H n=1 Tax=Schleiferia thermophila TaxID=884107 RepID=A0A369A8T8_9FLAO|nr:23S rRNA (pseudouridine(1915)-N(3))-methyltransferase RlmH [Schleiferia thermophila]RCX05739.1 23S rRNA (pseudouridine1915-N3)-methyltransferase [Schleiferia thermophila]GCD78774.1 ribosomal RNA large subunit methyltransferase H [Schleiferia thermophila]
MKITLLSIGKSNIDFVSLAEQYYLSKINYFAKVDLLKEEPKRTSSAESNYIKKNEADIILKNLSSFDYLVLFDERGVHLTSRELANFIQNLQMINVKRSLWVIGGSYGFHSSVYTKAHKLISLSKLTLSHQIVRIVVLEQFYRAFSILNNHPYHHD